MVVLIINKVLIYWKFTARQDSILRYILIIYFFIFCKSTEGENFTN